MKIPKYIKEYMHKVHGYAALANYYNEKVATWLEGKGVDIEEISCGNGYSFEELMYGNDVVEALCKKYNKYTDQQQCGQCEGKEV